MLAVECLHQIHTCNVANAPHRRLQVAYDSTRMKHVSFAETAEEYEFEPSTASDDSSSIDSVSEEALLAAQGGDSSEAPPSPPAVGYGDMMSPGSVTSEWLVRFLGALAAVALHIRRRALQLGVTHRRYSCD